MGEESSSVLPRNFSLDNLLFGHRVSGFRYRRSITGGLLVFLVSRNTCAYHHELRFSTECPLLHYKPKGGSRARNRLEKELGTPSTVSFRRGFRTKRCEQNPRCWQRLFSFYGPEKPFFRSSEGPSEGKASCIGGKVASALVQSALGPNRHKGARGHYPRGSNTMPKLRCSLPARNCKMSHLWG